LINIRCVTDQCLHASSEWRHLAEGVDGNTTQQLDGEWPWSVCSSKTPICFSVFL